MNSKTVVHMIGNAHLDPVWLWAWQAGVDEALATFRSAADRLEEYPEFVYTRGEAWLYRQVERLDPELFGRVTRLVAQGRWHVVGGQWVQPDANLPTAMGWHRQFRHGRRYFRERFGVEPRVAYNVDSFGHPATLPDLLAASGMSAYVLHRPNAQQLALPGATFRWRGTGGAEVLAYRIPSPYVTRTDDLYGQVMLALDAADPELGHVMCFYGVGNHGGGPTRGNIEYILEHRDAFPGAELRFSTPDAFFDAAAASHDRLPVVDAELQRTFPGCYSVMHDIKQEQVRGEHRLDQAGQLVDRLSLTDAERLERHARLDAAWEDLLFTEFHDILAGTSIPSAWPGVRAMQGRARLAAEEVALETTRGWARARLASAGHQQLVVVNADDEPFDDLLEAEPLLDFDAWGGRWLADADGNLVPVQLVQPEASILLANRILFPARAPAGGAGVYLVRDDPRALAPSDTDLRVSETVLENARVRVEVGPGGVARLILDGRDVLGSGGIGLHLRRDGSDTWSFHADRFAGPVDQRLEDARWTVEESGPLRARVRLEAHLGRSRLRWTVSLQQGDPRVRMRLEVVFAERYRLLQVAVHLAGRPSSWTDGLAGGQVRREPNPGEWPFQGWSRVRTEAGTLALVTPDAYSLSVEGDRWQLTLLRSPRMAWGGGDPDVYAGRDQHTDQGEQVFDIDLHVAGPDDAGVLEPDALEMAARAMARPPIVFDRYEGMSRPPWHDAPPRRLWTGAEQRARRDGHMAHLVDSGEGGVEENS